MTSTTPGPAESSPPAPLHTAQDTKAVFLAPPTSLGFQGESLPNGQVSTIDSILPASESGSEHNTTCCRQPDPYPSSKEGSRATDPESKGQNHQIRAAAHEIEAERAPRKTRRCIICDEDMLEDHFPSQVTQQCSHDTYTCKSCIQAWLASQLQQRGWDMIVCPECSSHLHQDDMQNHADRDTYDRYSILAKRAAFNANPSIRWCLRAGCTSGQIHKPTVDGPMFECQDCHSKFCVVHNVAWHTGETCEQYEHQHKNEVKKINKQRKKSENWKITWTRLCPQCRAPIQKTGGCKMMICSKCSHCFKWNKALRYTQGEDDSDMSKQLHGSFRYKVIHWIYQPTKVQEFWDATKQGGALVILVPSQYLIRLVKGRR